MAHTCILGPPGCGKTTLIKILAEIYKATTAKKKKDPNAEKKAPSAYNLFVKEQMITLKKENPDMDNKKIMSEAAILWKSYKENLGK
jgi:ABC-type cobalamin/Fe3+-siderophores transport system ATPase subunit